MDETDSESSSDSDQEDQGTNHRPANLRQIPRVNYNCRALPREITTDDEPKLSVALKSPERKLWLKAIEEEFNTLTEAGTWETSNAKPPTGKVISSGIILKLKRNADGLLARLKGSLVAHGNFQPDEDFDGVEIYAPVTSLKPYGYLFQSRRVRS